MTTVPDLVAARLYESEEAAVQDALRHLLRARPDLRLNLAVHRYQIGAISLSASDSYRIASAGCVRFPPAVIPPW